MLKQLNFYWYFLNRFLIILKPSICSIVFILIGINLFHLEHFKSNRQYQIIISTWFVKNCILIDKYKKLINYCWQSFAAITEDLLLLTCFKTYLNLPVKLVGKLTVNGLLPSPIPTLVPFRIRNRKYLSFHTFWKWQKRSDHKAGCQDLHKSQYEQLTIVLH